VQLSVSVKVCCDVMRRWSAIHLFTLLLCSNTGLLPRPEGKWEDIPLPMPQWNRSKMDSWASKRALFGQNDYIGM